jgi:ribosomal protein L37AE/L43A
MDLKKLETIIHVKSCPHCNIGIIKRTEERVYICDHPNCGAVYDFSSLSESMIRALLERYEQASG